MNKFRIDTQKGPDFVQFSIHVDFFRPVTTPNFLSAIWRNKTYDLPDPMRMEQLLRQLQNLHLLLCRSLHADRGAWLKIIATTT